MIWRCVSSFSVKFMWRQFIQGHQGTTKWPFSVAETTVCEDFSWVLKQITCIINRDVYPCCELFWLYQFSLKEENCQPWNASVNWKIFSLFDPLAWDLKDKTCLLMCNQATAPANIKAPLAIKYLHQPLASFSCFSRLVELKSLCHVYTSLLYKTDGVTQHSDHCSW